jgi:protein phosphatase
MLALHPEGKTRARRPATERRKVGDQVSAALGLEAAALTDVGMRRTTNQDSHALLTADSPQMLESRGHLLMVADGMGAHAAGELASKLAAEGVPHLYRKYAELSPPEALLRAFRETNTEINRRGSASTDFHNMGTTSSVLVLHPKGAIAGHVGDSRVYRLRNGVISQLTFDHSLQWELRASGQMPEGSDISAVVPKNVITRSLGPNPSVEIDLEGPHPIAIGDVYLLCSDGLTGRVEDEEIGAILASLSPEEAAQALLDLANLRGGPDNITVVLGKVTGSELAAGHEPAEPLRLSGPRRLQPTNMLIWIAAGTCLLASGILAGMGYMDTASVVLGGAGVAALVAIGHRAWATSGTALGRDKMLGKGPYTSVDCRPNAKLVNKLRATLDELREAARDGDWSIEWRPLDESFRQAQAAVDASNFPEAVRHYCRGISYVMNELRQQNVKKAGDSAVSY